MLYTCQTLSQFALLTILWNQCYPHFRDYEVEVHRGWKLPSFTHVKVAFSGREPQPGFKSHVAHSGSRPSSTSGMKAGQVLFYARRAFIPYSLPWLSVEERSLLRPVCASYLGLSPSQNQVQAHDPGVTAHILFQGYVSMIHNKTFQYASTYTFVAISGLETHNPLDQRRFI